MLVLAKSGLEKLGADSECDSRARLVRVGCRLGTDSEPERGPGGSVRPARVEAEPQCKAGAKARLALAGVDGLQSARLALQSYRKTSRTTSASCPK